MPKKSKKFNKKLLWVWAGWALILVVIFALVYFIAIREDKVVDGTKSGTTTADGSTVDLSPPSQADKNEAEAHKDVIIKRDEQIKNNSSNPSSGSQSSVVITEKSATGVKAYVTGVFEDGGTCVATASKGSTVVTATSTGFKNVSYTQCPPLQWSSPLGAGTWSINVEYKSNTTQSSYDDTLQV